MTSLKEKVKKGVLKTAKKQAGPNSAWAWPRLKGVVINVGVGRLVAQSAKPEDIISRIAGELSAITGQKPVVTKAKKAIASFKTRTGMPIGLKVTLHGDKMFDFLEKFINVASPRTRDFQGISESCVDRNGNLNIGLKDHTIFPETAADAAHTFSLEFSVIVESKSRADSLEFFKALGIPFKRTV